jgi:hypothetical protein
MGQNWPWMRFEDSARLSVAADGAIVAARWLRMQSVQPPDKLGIGETSLIPKSHRDCSRCDFESLAIANVATVPRAAKSHRGGPRAGEARMKAEKGGCDPEAGGSADGPGLALDAF